MNLTHEPPSILRNIRQRALLNDWLRLFFRRRSIPPLDEFKPDRFEEEMSELVVYDVLEATDGVKYNMRHVGERQIAAYDGAADLGRDLEQTLGAQRAADILPLYHACRDTGLPVYSVAVLSDINGREVNYKRLLLPFGESPRVLNIVAVFKNFSPDGGYEQRSLTRIEQGVPVYRHRAIISKGLEVPSSSGGRRRGSSESIDLADD